MSGADGTTAGTGVYLDNVQAVTLRRMTINGTNQNYGLRGFLVSVRSARTLKCRCSRGLTVTFVFVFVPGRESRERDALAAGHSASRCSRWESL